MGMFALGWLGGYAAWAALTPTCKKGTFYGVTPKRSTKSKKSRKR
jgi:hypothetical protein